MADPVPATAVVHGDRIGVNRLTGAYITEFDHCVQSMWDLFTTRIGTRIMRLDYGSSILGLVDKPGNRQVLASFYASIATALVKWEPGFRVTQFQLLDAHNGSGQFDFLMVGIFFPRGHLGDYSISEDETMRFVLSPIAGELVIVGPAL